jgi:phosphoenolpyruvate-protein phosphotransferase (PTS system enzyme I)
MARAQAESVRAELCLTGVGVAPGIAIGTVFRIDNPTATTNERALLPEDIRGELDRLHNAIMLAHSEIDQGMRGTEGLPANAAEEINRMLEAHKIMLEGSRLTRGIEVRIKKQLINAEAALHQEVEALSHSFAVMEDTYLAARGADVRAVGALILNFLLQQPYRTLAQAPKDAVIIASELTPNDTAGLNPKRIRGLVTTAGGAEGHTAIMARALGLPAVMSAQQALPLSRDGDVIILDGREGLVILHPTAATLKHYKELRARIEARKQELQKLKTLPSKTKDGTTIKLHANIELPDEVAGALDANAAGIGLMRTEFLFMGRNSLPSAEEQEQAIRKAVKAMNGKPVTIRTLDIGGEKIAPALSRHYAKSPNPALGLRGIRLSLAEPYLLRDQFIAALKASKEGELRIMLPMLTLATEIKQAKELLAATAKELGHKGKLPALGIMIEVPAAALQATQLAKLADFFALGTNDLTQYTLATDRADEKVAALYDPLHPAVLQLIKLTAAAGKKANIPVSVCGEMAGDARRTELLLDLGIRELSMTPSSILTIKQKLRELKLKK